MLPCRAASWVYITDLSVSTYMLSDMYRYLFCTESNAVKCAWGSLSNNPHSTDIVLDNKIHCWTLKCPAFIIYIFYHKFLSRMCTHVYILCFSLSCSLLLIYHYSVIIGSKYVICALCHCALQCASLSFLWVPVRPLKWEYEPGSGPPDRS